MATKSNLMGLGVAHLQAAVQATEPTTGIGSGASIGDALAIGGNQYLLSLTSVTSGGGVKLPPLGGSTGCLLGDDFIINNQGANTVIVYAATNGSAAPNFSFSGSSINGSLGVSIASHKSATFYCITSTSWLGLLST